MSCRKIACRTFSGFYNRYASGMLEAEPCRGGESANHFTALDLFFIL